MFEESRIFYILSFCHLKMHDSNILKVIIKLMIWNSNFSLTITHVFCTPSFEWTFTWIIFLCFFLPAIYCGNILFVQNFVYFWRIYCWFYRLQDVSIIMNSSSCDIMYYGGTNSCRGLSDKCHRNVPGVDLFLILNGNQSHLLGAFRQSSDLSKFYRKAPRSCDSE